MPGSTRPMCWKPTGCGCSPTAPANGGRSPSRPGPNAPIGTPSTSTPGTSAGGGSTTTRSIAGARHGLRERPWRPPAIGHSGAAGIQVSSGWSGWIRVGATAAGRLVDASHGQVGQEHRRDHQQGHLQASRIRDDLTRSVLGLPLKEGVTERSPLLRLLLSGGARTPVGGGHRVRRIRALAPRPRPAALRLGQPVWLTAAPLLRVNRSLFEGWSAERPACR